MASQQDIHAAGAENRPPVLEKGGYLPWTSRMLRYIKTKDLGNLMLNSIKNGPFQPRQVQIAGNPSWIRCIAISSALICVLSSSV
jgi:hypothetical protein